MSNNNVDLEVRTAAKEQTTDGPSYALLHFMDSYNYEPPYDWSGYSYDY